MPSILENTLVPTGGTQNHTLHDTNALPTDVTGIEGNCTTAGVLPVVFHGDDTVILYDLPTGRFVIDGNIKLVKTTSLTAVLSNSRVVARRYKPYATAKH